MEKGDVTQLTPEQIAAGWKVLRCGKQKLLRRLEPIRSCDALVGYPAARWYRRRYSPRLGRAWQTRIRQRDYFGEREIERWERRRVNG